MNILSNRIMVTNTMMMGTTIAKLFLLLMMIIECCLKFFCFCSLD